MNTAADIRFVLRSEGVQTPVRLEGYLRRQDTVAKTVMTPAASAKKPTAKELAKTLETTAKTAGAGV